MAASFISDIKIILGDVKDDLINLVTSRENAERINMYFNHTTALIEDVDTDYKLEKHLQEKNIFHPTSDVLVAVNGK